MASDRNSGGEATASHAVYGVAVFLLLSSIALGGATTSGYGSDVVLQFVAIPAMLVALWCWLDRLGGSTWRTFPSLHRLTFNVAVAGAMALCATIIVLAQYLPVFGAAGFNGLFARIDAVGGMSSAAGALTGTSSIESASSRATLPSLLPPLGLFLLVALLDTEQRTRFVGWLLVCGIVSLILGILQVMQGPDSSLRLYEISNRSEAIGFFANRNHFAALLYTTVILGVGWFSIRGEGLLSSSRINSTHALWFAGLFMFLLLLMAGIALARSRAGILLALVAVAGIVAISPTLLSLLRGGEVSAERRSRRIIFLGLALLLLGVGQMGGERFLHRFDGGVTDYTRSVLRNVTMQAAVEALPIGTGMSTFPSVYEVYEGEGTLRPFFVNRAHNDWLEFALEAGLAGILLISLFLIWFVGRVFRIWMQPLQGNRAANLILHQSASLAVLMILLHSFVDYPLRTAAMAACFAACCALMLPPRVKSTAHEARRQGKYGVPA